MQGICCIKADGHMHMFGASLMQLNLKQSLKLVTALQLRWHLRVWQWRTHHQALCASDEVQDK